MSMRYFLNIVKVPLVEDVIISLMDTINRSNKQYAVFTLRNDVTVKLKIVSVLSNGGSERILDLKGYVWSFSIMGDEKRIHLSKQVEIYYNIDSDNSQLIFNSENDYTNFRKSIEL